MSFEPENPVGQRINFFYREYLKCSQLAFAERIGVSQSMVSAISSSRNTKPGLDMLTGILKAYPQVSADWLLNGEGPMLRDGRMPPAVMLPAVMPKPADEEAQPRHALSDAEAAVIRAEVEVLRAQLQHAQAQNDLLRQELSKALGK